MNIVEKQPWEMETVIEVIILQVNDTKESLQPTEARREAWKLHIYVYTHTHTHTHT